jgi:hypothetical protein
MLQRFVVDCTDLLVLTVGMALTCAARHGRTDQVKNCETRSRIMKKDEFMCARAHGLGIIIILSNNDKASDGRDHD